MAISFVQNATAGVSSPTATFGSNTTTGNLVVVAIGASVNSTTVTSITDSQSNVYRKAIRQTSSGADTLEIWYSMNITGGTTPTVTPNMSSGVPGICIYEYSGLATSSALDQTNSNTGAAGTVSTGNITTTFANELVFAAMISEDNMTVGAGWGHFRTDNFTLAGAGDTVSAEDQIVSSTGTFNGAFGATPTTTWAAAIASFSDTPAPTPSVTDSGANYLFPHHVIVGNGMSRSEVAN